MAVSYVQQRKRQKYLIGAFVFIVLITVFVWWRYLREGAPITPIPLVITPAYQKVDIDFKTLQGDFLEESQIFEDIGFPEGEIGRENPFTTF